jgi:hypothetical protein
MSGKEREKQHSELKDQEDRERVVVVHRHVMETLGTPAELQRVQVRRLWEDRYRVNVYVGKDIACARIANSFFLVTDKDGHIVDASPPLAKVY